MQCFPFLFAMSVTQVKGNRFDYISDGEECTVCTFLSKEENVVKNSQKWLKRPKMCILRVLPSSRVTVPTSHTCES